MVKGIISEFCFAEDRVGMKYVLNPSPKKAGNTEMKHNRSWELTKSKDLCMQQLSWRARPGERPNLPQLNSLHISRQDLKGARTECRDDADTHAMTKHLKIFTIAYTGVRDYAPCMAQGILFNPHHNLLTSVPSLFPFYNKETQMRQQFFPGYIIGE